MKQYETFELRFEGKRLTEGWASIDLAASFTHGGETRTVKGFYDGGGQYVIRFLPEQPGEYAWRVTGAVSAEGKASCEPANGLRGPVRAVGEHFEYANGGLFLPFGTTVYALASQDDALVEETLRSLQAAPFNKVRMCVFPKHYDYNRNEPPFYAFEKRPDGGWDTSRPCIAFWHRLEGILKRIQEMGIQIDLILFHPYDRWGFASLPRESNLEYLDYLLRRLSAMPGVWWSLANEYDLDQKSLAEWEEIEEYVAAGDPYRHLLSCHNCMCFWDFSRENVTHCSIQTKALTEIPRWIKRYQKPVVIDECCYEGNLPHLWGSIPAREMVRRFWRCCASGGYCTHGETLLAGNDILWWARGGTLRGESAARIAFLRRIMESLPGPLAPSDGGLAAWAQLSETEIMEKAPAEARDFLRLFAASVRRMEDRDKWLQLAAEHCWEAHCGEDAYLLYCDLQCYSEQTLRLPEHRRYRVDVIDTWGMARSTVLENACGDTRVPLPGREGMAILAVSK